MSTTFLFKIYNATVCEITMQASSDSVDSKLLKPSTLCQYWVIKWGSIFNTEIYRENVKQSSFQELLCYSLRDYYASILRNLGTYDNFSKFYDNLEECYMYKFWKRYEQCFLVEWCGPRAFCFGLNIFHCYDGICNMIGYKFSKQ